MLIGFPMNIYTPSIQHYELLPNRGGEFVALNSRTAFQNYLTQQLCCPTMWPSFRSAPLSLKSLIIWCIEKFGIGKVLQTCSTKLYKCRFINSCRTIPKISKIRVNLQRGGGEERVIGSLKAQFVSPGFVRFGAANFHIHELMNLKKNNNKVQSFTFGPIFRPLP